MCLHSVTCDFILAEKLTEKSEKKEFSQFQCAIRQWNKIQLFHENSFHSLLEMLTEGFRTEHDFLFCELLKLWRAFIFLNERILLLPKIHITIIDTHLVNFLQYGELTQLNKRYKNC